MTPPALTLSPEITTPLPSQATAVLVHSADAVSTADIHLSVNVVLLGTTPHEAPDPLVEEAMDYTPIQAGKLAAPDFPDEEWPEEPGPLGF